MTIKIIHLKYMDVEKKIKIIGEKLYIQLFLLEKKFINSVKIKYD